jgi:hypothetical protein
MPMNFSHGYVQWLTTDVLNSTKVVTGLGFMPKAIRFYWVGLQVTPPTNAVSGAVNERRGVGFAINESSILDFKRCIGTFSQDNAGSANCGSVFANNCIAITVDGNGTIDGRLDINSFDADGFTLAVDDVTPANITVFYEAWGGVDIQGVYIGSIAEPAATGNQTYGASGFTSDGRNQVVMFAGCQSTAAVNTGQAQDSGLCVGFATSTATVNNVNICGSSNDGQGTMVTAGYIKGGECISNLSAAAGNPTARAILSGWGTNQFTLNWTERGTTNRRYIYLAIKGGSWQAQGITIAGNTLNSTTTVSGLEFNLRGISLFTRNTAESVSDTATANDVICMGTGVSTTSRNSAGVLDRNNVGTSEIYTIVQYSSVLSVPSTAAAVQATYDINNFAVNTFQLIVDTAGGVASTYIGGLYFGDTKYPTNLSIGHPFIM